ncbi:MAG: hypothetical protein U0168_23540 [Nannocystaceae bacterium]
MEPPADPAGDLGSAKALVGTRTPDHARVRSRRAPRCGGGSRGCTSIGSAATDDAVAVLEEAIADQPDDREAIDELDALLTRLGRWTDVRDNLERKLVAASGGERVAVLEQLARLSRIGSAIPSTRSSGCSSC